MKIRLAVLPLPFAICRLDAKAPIPAWAEGEFISITRTVDELSIVAPQSCVPQQVESSCFQCSSDWRAIRVVGRLELSLTGVIASLVQPLAEAEISVFTLATFDTDYLLLQQANLADAIQTFRNAGHQIAS